MHKKNPGSELFTREIRTLNTKTKDSAEVFVAFDCDSAYILFYIPFSAYSIMHILNGITIGNFFKTNLWITGEIK